MEASVKNPLRSEAAAYRFLMGTIAYFGLIALASLAGGRWWGLGAFVALTAAGVWWLVRGD